MRDSRHGRKSANQNSGNGTSTGSGCATLAVVAAVLAFIGGMIWLKFVRLQYVCEGEGWLCYLLWWFR